MPKTTRPATPDSATIHEAAQKAAEDIIERISRSEAAVEPFVFLLTECGALPSFPENVQDDDPVFERRSKIIDFTFYGVCAYLLESGELVEALLRSLPHSAPGSKAPMPLDPRVRNAIRTFFLEPQRSYTYAELGSLFSEQLADNAVSMSGDPRVSKSATRLSWRDAAYAVLIHFHAAVLEDALEAEASRVLPDGYRTKVVRMRLPQHVIVDLETKADEYGYGFGDITAVIENHYGAGDEPVDPFRSVAKKPQSSS